jgi:hypothetical protein
MTVTGPGAAVLGATEQITVAWAGLEAGTRFLGAVSHADDRPAFDGVFDWTIIRIDTD